MLNHAPRLLALLFAAASLPGQEWNDEQLRANTPQFQSDSLVARLQQVGVLLAAEPACAAVVAASLHGDHREYLVRIERLLGELIDDSWAVREAAERTLIEVGARARTLIEQRRDRAEVLEQQLRCSRILDALAARDTEQEEREVRLLRGLATTALYFGPRQDLRRALRSALGHTDSTVVDAAIRALGRCGSDDEVPPVVLQLEANGRLHRQAALAALARMPAPAALQHCQTLLADAAVPLADRMVLVRTLRSRADAEPAVAAMLATLGSSGDALVAAAARAPMPADGGQTTAARLALPDPIEIEVGFAGILGDSLRVVGGIEGLPRPELPFAQCDRVDFPTHTGPAATQPRIFLNQGSLVVGELLTVDAAQVAIRSAWFGDVMLPRAAIQGIALDPNLDRLVGGSSEHDRVRLRTGEFVDGELQAVDARQARIATRAIARDDAAGILFRRPRGGEPDASVYTRVDLVGGERLLGFVCASNGTHLGLAVPQLGVAMLPLTKVQRIEFGIGGGALWGFTLIADYSDNRVVEVDEQGRVLFSLEDVYAVWDAECLDNNNLLVTEYATSRVREVNRLGEDVWVFEDLRSPYDADRLPNGNTLIADTFGMRVIEVDREKKIVWSYQTNIRPVDCDRLPNGNTLIADLQNERVLEVTPAGEVLWEQGGFQQLHDADRLPNGNTLITMRSNGTVVEIDRSGRVVWDLKGLSSPSDADRLPNGNTVVAENNKVREFDRRGTVVWQKEMMWAVEVNRY